MLHLLSHGRHFAVAVGSAAAHDRAISLSTLVHFEQVVHHKSVARHDGQHQYEHNGGVQVGVDPVFFSLWVHVDKAPCARTVLYIRTKTREREETERCTQQKHQWDRNVGTFLGDVLVVQVGVPDGEAPLQRHGKQKRHGGQAEEGHADTKVFAHNVRLRRHPLQGCVLRVRKLHKGTDQTGASQVCDHQRRDEDVKQSPPPHVPGPHLSTAPHFQDDQGCHVAKDASSKHDGTDDGALGGVDVVLAVARVVFYIHADFL